ncbi:MAG: PIN domain-containing protein [Chloroflexi bacterium]|nr:PIN domain-containing protein [Chloroflexota bacterium]
MKFVDTNIFIRYLTRDDPHKSAACRLFWQQVAQGQETAATTEAVIAEVCYVLSAPRLYHLSQDEVAARLRPLLTLPGLKLPHKRSFLRALDLYALHPFLDFEDALQAAHMERLGLQEILSYDTGFDHLPGITRLEPEP